MLPDPDSGLLIILGKGLQARQWRCAVQLLFTFVCLSLSLAACGRALAPPSSQEGGEADVLSFDEALRRDAQQYAEEMGVTLDEAMHRFQYMDDFGELNAALTAHEQDTFAGLWVEHQPEFRVIVLFTNRGARTVRPYIRDKSWAHLVEVRPASVTLAELEDIYADVQRILDELDFDVNSALDVKGNRVEVWVTDADWFEQELRKANLILPDHVDLVAVQGQSAKDLDVCAASTVPGVAFPRQTPVEGIRATMEAELIGGLTLVDGCLRVNSLYGPASYLPVWPPEFALKVVDNEIKAVDGTGQVVAHMDQEVYLSGGEGSAAAMPDCVREQLPAGCAGPYWVVGEAVRPNLRHDSELFSLDVISITERSVLFLRKKPVLDGWTQGNSLLAGKLVVYDFQRCVRVEADSGDYLLLWPPEYKARAENGLVEIVDGSGQVVARAGDEVRLEGGEIPVSWDLDHYKQLYHELPGDCSGPYWVVSGDSAEGPVYSLTDLIDDLRALGLAVVSTERPVDHGFGIEGVRVLVDDVPVFVYEFADVTAAQAAAAGVSTDAYSMTITRSEGEMTYEHHGDWEETPHVYLKGRVIVVTGDDPPVVDALDTVLGPPLAPRSPG